MERPGFGNVSVGDFRPPNIQIPKGVAGFLPLAILVVVLLWSAFYTVAAEEVGVVLTFGKFSKTTDPGLMCSAVRVTTVDGPDCPGSTAS